MKQRFNITRLLLLMLAVLVAGQQYAHAQSASQVVSRLQAKYKGVSTLEADFTQTMSSSYGSGEQTLSGKLYLQGSKYRVESPSQTYVTDGKLVWIYNANENQVLVNNNVSDETTFNPNDFIFEFDKHYSATGVKEVTSSGRKQYMLSLKPKRENSLYRDVTLWINTNDMLITRLDVVDVNDAKVTVTMRNIQLNPKLNADLFTFRAPSNAEVVDLRS